MKHIVLAITIAATGLVGLAAASASAQPPSPCEAALFAKNPNLKNLKKIVLKDAKAVPKGIKVTQTGARFDPSRWVLKDTGEGVATFEAKGDGKKKKKKKKKKGGKKPAEAPKYASCICSSYGGSCHTFVDTKTGSITCEVNRCEGECGVAIFGDATDLTTIGFETP